MTYLRPHARLAIISWLTSFSSISVGSTDRTVSNTASHTPGDRVVLLHGLGRSSLSMKRLEWALHGQGFQVLNPSYPSTRLSVEAAADWLDRWLKTQVPPSTGRTHFVTHSLGGIIVRQYLALHPHPELGRVVMLAPPNHGSEVADHLRDNIVFKLCTGPAGQQLGTGASGVLCQLGPADFDVGIIAGDRSLNALFSFWIPGPDDGKVSVESSRVEGMRDFLVVHHSHTWMMWRREVIQSVGSFLTTGSFAGVASAGQRDCP